MKTITRYIMEQADGLLEVDWYTLRNTIAKEIGWSNISLIDRREVTDRDPHLADPSNRYYIYTQRGVVVGYCNVNIEDVIWIGDFEISKKHRGQGYGKKFANDIIRKFSHHQLMLTYRDDIAHRFWKSIGFKDDHAKVMIHDK